MDYFRVRRYSLRIRHKLLLPGSKANSMSAFGVRIRWKYSTDGEPQEYCPILNSA